MKEVFFCKFLKLLAHLRQVLELVSPEGSGKLPSLQFGTVYIGETRDVQVRARLCGTLYVYVLYRIIFYIIPVRCAEIFSHDFSTTTCSGWNFVLALK